MRSYTPALSFWKAHSYPMVWYDLSIQNPTFSDNPLGFQRSFEYTRLPGVNLPFPPTSTDLRLGRAYHQTPFDFDQLTLEQLPIQNLFQLLVPLFGNAADEYVNTLPGPIQVVGSVSSDFIDAAGDTANWVAQGFDYVGNTALQGGQSLVNLYNSTVLRLHCIRRHPQSAHTGTMAVGKATLWRWLGYLLNSRQTRQEWHLISELTGTPWTMCSCVVSAHPTCSR